MALTSFSSGGDSGCLGREWTPSKHSDALEEAGLGKTALSLQPGDAGPNPSFSSTLCGTGSKYSPIS